MSTWKNILTDPPAPGTGIRVTDGKSVFVGHIMQNVPWFTGVSMDDGSEITISADLLTEWMPLAAPEKEKTLEDLGYIAVHHCGSIFYQRGDVKRIHISGNNVAAWFGDEPVALSWEEIIALARLIEKEKWK